MPQYESVVVGPVGEHEVAVREIAGPAESSRWTASGTCTKT